jgi:hypothetical protein
LEGTEVTYQQIIEQSLAFSFDQHKVKDKLIEDLQKQNAELQNKLNDLKSGSGRTGNV